MNKYEPVIGIEVHVELNTKSKMFCRCSADYFGKEPNTHTCPVCLGLPGALPYINEEAIRKCIQIGLALNCSINDTSYFERKNYFYPDLPKGYQISQLVKPLCINGWLEIEGDDGVVKKIRVNRAHQEEDTGKLVHGGWSTEDGEGNNDPHPPTPNPRATLIDFNRSCVPLVEIVTEPDFHDSSEVRDYAKKLQQIFKTLKVSNADMEKGDMRLEANVSIRLVGQTELPPYRVELKNINSFRFMVAAIEYEIKRQIEALENGEKLTQETRGWNEAKRESYLQRSKEEAHDYRYFPEPDLPELQISSEQEKQLKDGVEVLLKSHPEQKKEYFVKTFGMSLASAGTIAYSPEKTAVLESVVSAGTVSSDQVASFGNYLANRRFIASIGSGVVESVLVPEKARELAEDFNAKQVGVITDEAELEKLVKEAIEENPKVVEDFQKGKESALQVLIGAVMKKSSGKADVGKLKSILEDLLAKE